LTMKTHKECLPAQGRAVLKKLGVLVSRHTFILAGGTALALRKGHRLSYDLDFFSAKDFRNDTVITEIRKVTKDFQVITEEAGSLTLDIEGVKVSFFRYEYPFLDTQDALAQTRLAGILDIAAMKVIALVQRGVKRDFVDLYVILQEVPFHKIAAHMLRRYGQKRISPVSIGKALVWFADADTNPEPAYIKGRELNWEDIKKFFRLHVKQFVFDLEAEKKKI
jgi:hypothetical protein